MATTINADTVTGGAIVTGDASGVLELQAAGVTKLTVNGSGVALSAPLPVASGGTGVTSLSGITVGTATNLAGGSNGTVPYQSALGTTQMLAVGTSGQVLRSNGAAAPSWVTPSSGALVYLSTVTASGSSTVNIETTFSSTYDAYMLIASNVSISADQLYSLLKISGSYATSGYTYVMNYTDASQAVNTQLSRTSASDGTTSKMRLTNATNNPMNFIMYVYSPTSGVEKTVSWSGVYGGGNVGEIDGVGGNSGTGALTGVQFNANTGTVTGTFRLYGIVNS